MVPGARGQLGKRLVWHCRGSVSKSCCHQVVSQVLVQVRKVQEQLEELVALGGGVRAAILRQCLHGEVGIAEEPIHSVGIHRPALLAKL